MVDVELSNDDFCCQVEDVSEGFKGSEPGFDDELVGQSQLDGGFFVDLLGDQELKLSFSFALEIGILLVVPHHVLPITRNHSIIAPHHLAIHVEHDMGHFFFVVPLVVDPHIAVRWS